MKRMKYLLNVGLVLVGFTTLAADTGWRGEFGYRYVSGLDFQQSHDTHPEDRWLPNGDVPGSAGTTRLSDAHVIQFGVSRDYWLRKNFVIWSSLEMGVGVNMDNHKNANDYRPDENAAFVFSWPALLADAGVGVGWDIGRVRLGGELRGGGLLIVSGYDRFSSLDVRDTDWKWIYGAGPTISVRLSESLGMEARALFGNVNSFTIGVTRRF